MRDMNEVLAEALEEELKQARESEANETLTTEKPRHIPDSEKDVYRAKIQLGATVRYIGMRVPLYNPGMRGRNEVETFCTPMSEYHEFKPMNMQGIDAENARDVLERFRKTIREEISKFIKEAENENW